MFCNMCSGKIHMTENNNESLGFGVVFNLVRSHSHMLYWFEIVHRNERNPVNTSSLSFFLVAPNEIKQNNWPLPLYT